MPLPRDRALFVLLLLAALLGLAYNAVILLGYGPDEPRHMAYVNLLFQEHTLPRLNSDGTEYRGAHTLHPPLYYLLLTPFWAAAHTLPRDFGWHVVRLVSLALCLASLPLIYQMAERAGGGSRALARLAVAQAALLPIFGMTAGGINNDSATLLAVTLFLWLLVVKYPRDRSLKSAAALGLCFGLGGLCKATALICDGPALVVYLLAQEGVPAALRSPRMWGRLAIILLLVTAISGPWYWRNFHLYGQFTPIPSGYSLPALPRPSYGVLIMMFHPNFPAAFTAANWGIFYSLWSQKDWIPLPIRLPIYLALALYCLLALAGLARRGWSGRRAGGAARPAPDVSGRLAAWAPLSAFALNWITCASIALFVHWGWAEGGRYLLPSISGLAVTLALGWRGLVGERCLGLVMGVWVVCLLALNGLCLFWLFHYLNPTFGPGSGH